jgi:hypothetical protein
MLVHWKTTLLAFPTSKAHLDFLSPCSTFIVHFKFFGFGHLRKFNVTPTSTDSGQVCTCSRKEITNSKEPCC